MLPLYGLLLPVASRVLRLVSTLSHSWVHHAVCLHLLLELLLLLLGLHLLQSVLADSLLLPLFLNHHWIRLHVCEETVTVNKNVLQNSNRHRFSEKQLHLLTGITKAAKVLPLTTRRSYMMF